MARLFNKHIQGTLPKAMVAIEFVYICRLTSTVLKIIGRSDFKVHISTIILKHLYDKKPAEEFDCIVGHLHEIIKYPEKIYQNKISKSGDYCLIKKVNGCDFLCSLQFSGKDGDGKIMVVTAFRVRDGHYLKNYELLWSWKGDIPSS